MSTRKRRDVPLYGPGAILLAAALALAAVWALRKKPAPESAAPEAAAAGLVAKELASISDKPPPKAAAAAGAAARPGKKVKNRLAKEKSPYLLQHADNPVDWMPWGPEAFARAKSENKPIFLSIGYSTCHWCHVMERESFVDERIAKVLNEHFVSVKVDREERPDVDKIYMTAAQGAGWGGGWPLSMWLTPELKPFFGGTYFPPDSRGGRPGFLQILGRVAELWRTRRTDLSSDAERLAAGLAAQAASSAGEADFSLEWAKAAVDQYAAAYDKTHGGFGGAPKFPMPVALSFLLRHYARTGEKRALEMAGGSLKGMSEGGIYDHVGGGFARYSVDADWRVPHFEKMLYDNAQLASVLLELHQAEKSPWSARAAQETLDYVLRDMRHAGGGFFSAEDADSLPAWAPDSAHKSEGAFYLWTKAELEALLGPDAALFCLRYGVEADGNALDDPHGEFTGRNILYAAKSLEEAAKASGLTPREAARSLSRSLELLRAERAKRPRPGLDDKVLASWNGLMLSAFARGAQVLEDPRYLDAGVKAAGFAREKLYDAKTKTLYHRWRDGERKIAGHADDYAFLAQGLVDLFEASFDPGHLEWAVELAETLLARFAHPDGGFYMTAEGEGGELLARIVEDYDNVEPSASSVAALTLLRLAQLSGREDFRAAGLKTIRRFGRQLEAAPRSLPAMLTAGAFASAKPRQIVIAGELGDPATTEMLRMVHARYRPDGVLIVATEASRPRLAKALPVLRGMRPIDGKTTAYLCENFTCELPTNDLAAVGRMLSGGK